MCVPDLYNNLLIAGFFFFLPLSFILHLIFLIYLKKFFTVFSVVQNFPPFQSLQTSFTLSPSCYLNSQNNCVVSHGNSHKILMPEDILYFHRNPVWSWFLSVCVEGKNLVSLICTKNSPEQMTLALVISQNRGGTAHFLLVIIALKRAMCIQKRIQI